MTKKYSPRELNAYHQGYDSFEDSQARKQNPFRYGCMRNTAWNDGWDEAQASTKERIAVATRDANTVGFY